jgi:hypothetical protein
VAGESAEEVARRSREKAERLIRHAEMYERGAAGERRTADRLATLPAGWVVLHDVRWPGRRFANIDHVVVGPSGIFVIDSKNWSGRVTLRDGVLRQNGRSREKQVAGCADAALATAELAGPYGAHVVPVLCLALDEGPAGWSRDVLVCTTEQLTGMLLSRTPVLSPQHVADVGTRLDLSLASAGGTARRALGVGVPDRSTSEAPARRRTAGSRTGAVRQRQQRAGVRRTTRRRRRQPTLRRFVLSLGLVCGLLIFGPGIANVVGDAVSELVVGPSR